MHEEWSTALRKPSCLTIVPENFPQSTRHKMSLDGAEMLRVQRIRARSSVRDGVWGDPRESVPQRSGRLLDLSPLRRGDLNPEVGDVSSAGVTPFRNTLIVFSF